MLILFLFSFKMYKRWEVIVLKYLPISHLIFWKWHHSKNTRNVMLMLFPHRRTESCSSKFLTSTGFVAKMHEEKQDLQDPAACFFIGSRIYRIHRQFVWSWSRVHRIQRQHFWVGSWIPRISRQNENVGSKICQDPRSWILRTLDPGSCWDLGKSLGLTHFLFLNCAPSFQGPSFYG